MFSVLKFETQQPYGRITINVYNNLKLRIKTMFYTIIIIITITIIIIVFIGTLKTKTPFTLVSVRSPSLGANNVLFLVEISFSQTELFLVLNFPRKIYAS